MNPAKKKRLERKGWRVGTASDFLKLSEEEAAYVELKVSLGKNLQALRREKQLTQQDLARLLKSSQSRIAKMEAGDPSVSIDLLIRSLLLMGASRKHLAEMLA